MQESRDQEQELPPAQTEGSNNQLTLTLTGDSSSSREQHEATIEQHLLSDVRLRREDS